MLNRSASAAGVLARVAEGALMSDSKIPPGAKSSREFSASGLLADARSALMDSIRNLTLEPHFSRTVLKAAETVALNATQWHGPVGWYRPDGSQAEALHAEIIESSSAHRRVTVYLYAQFGKTAVDSNCTCGARLCSHSAALLIRLRKLADWPRAMTPLQRWQHILRSPPQEAARKDAGPIESRTAICLLEASGQALSSLAARLVLVCQPFPHHGELQRKEAIGPYRREPVGTTMFPKHRRKRKRPALETFQDYRQNVDIAFIADCCQLKLCPASGMRSLGHRSKIISASFGLTWTLRTPVIWGTIAPSTNISETLSSATKMTGASPPYDT